MQTFSQIKIESFIQTGYRSLKKSEEDLQTFLVISPSPTTIKKRANHRYPKPCKKYKNNIQVITAMMRVYPTKRTKTLQINIIRHHT